MIGKILRICTASVALGGFLYAITYISAINDEAFVYVRKRLAESSAINHEVGNVKKIWLDPLGPYLEISFNYNKSIIMRVWIKGEKMSLNIELKLKKENGVWTIEQAMNQGLPFPLER